MFWQEESFVNKYFHLLLYSLMENNYEKRLLFCEKIFSPKLKLRYKNCEKIILLRIVSKTAHLSPHLGRYIHGK
jgi:hypothetical protein